MPQRYTSRIISLLARPERSALTSGELAECLAVDRELRGVFDAALSLLESEERAEKGPDGRWRLPQLDDSCEGILKVNRKGFGFVKPDRPCREGDIFIPPAAMGGAISGDHVRVTVARRRGGKGRGPAGRVDEVLTRSRSTFAGTVLNRRKNWLIRPMVAALQARSSRIYTPSPCVTVTRWCSSWWPVRTAMCW